MAKDTTKFIEAEGVVKEVLPNTMYRVELPTGTVVLAHLPCGQKGTGMKGPDQIAIFACHHCHQIVDGPRRWEVPAADYLRAQPAPPRTLPLS